MCDRIRETDERNVTINSILKESGCLEINQMLSKCLLNNGRDFRKCKNELDQLKICQEKSNSNKQLENQENI